MATTIGCAAIGLILGTVAYFTVSLASSLTSAMFTTVAFVGWATGDILIFIFLGLHIMGDDKRRTNRPYIENSTQVLLYRTAACVDLTAIITAAIEITLIFARQELVDV